MTLVKLFTSFSVYSFYFIFPVFWKITSETTMENYYVKIPETQIAFFVCLFYRSSIYTSEYSNICILEGSIQADTINYISTRNIEKKNGSF